MDMPEKIAAWRFDPTKADEWIHGGWSEDHDRKTTEYTRSDLAVEVKPITFDKHGAEWWGDTPFGIYVVAHVQFGEAPSAWCFWTPDDGEVGVFTTEQKALEGAQADYERRILSDLTTRPDDLRPKLQALISKWEGMTCRTKCAQELREVLEGGG